MAAAPSNSSVEAHHAHSQTLPHSSSSSYYSSPTPYYSISHFSRLGPSSSDSQKLEILERFRYEGQVDGGSLEVRLMGPEEVGATVKLLSESFADAMWVRPQQVRFLDFWVEQYLVQRMGQRPHAATLVGIYRRQGEGDEEPQVAGTAEVSFDGEGASPSRPTPAPRRRDAPYICNMAVKKSVRRKHIGWNLLKACEELVLKMCGSTEVYLHCRMIDKAPLNMYKKAHYKIVDTDSFLVWLMLQCRKHLMCKKLS